ncbi:MAG: preprotein translocase subunit SecG [candidate division WS1 bacterium]|nr:preprotein translocase subunit SecG [candidate division WS1 bacterium]
MMVIIQIISALLAIGLIVSVVMQTSKAESFSAAMGGTDSSQFRKGTREELLARLTKYFAIGWIVAMTVGAVIWYSTH